MPLKVAILVVSTTASKDTSTESSGKALRSLFMNQGIQAWEVMSTTIVGDDVLDIQRCIRDWTDSENSPNLIISTGGTGFAVNDITPEAIAPLLDKHAPGIVHGMLANSFNFTPFALISRPVAGIRKKTVIITLPGSPKGAKENLESVLKLLTHACQQAAGADSRTLHSGGLETLERDAGLRSSRCNSQANICGHSYPACHENYRSNNPAQGPVYRNRLSSYPMISVKEALELVREHSFNTRVKKVTVDANLIGYVLAEDVTATEAVPAYRASIVDGYAVTTPHNGLLSKGTYHVLPASTDKFDQKINMKIGEIFRITTGAPLPKSATAVVMVEDTVLKCTSEDGREEKEVEILADGVKAGDNVREIGSDIQIGDIILRKGEQISATGGELGLLASVGKKSVSVYERPVVGVLSTGDEIVDYNRPGNLQPGEVRDCNRLAITAAAQKWGFHIVDLYIARDQPGELEQILRDGLRKVDLIITSGGVSMGEHDLLKSIIERALGGTIHFGRVSMKPGKPTTFATIPVTEDTGRWPKKLIFSLPGNPASALVAFHIFILPSLHFASGISPAGLPKVTVVLDHDFWLDRQRTEFHRVQITFGNDGLLHASSTGGQRSSRVGSLRKANGLLFLPAGNGIMSKDETVEAFLMERLNSYLDLKDWQSF